MITHFYLTDKYTVDFYFGYSFTVNGKSEANILVHCTLTFFFGNMNGLQQIIWSIDAKQVGQSQSVIPRLPTGHFIHDQQFKFYTSHFVQIRGEGFQSDFD